jgi:ribosome biogenesis protein UTP30
MPKCELNGDDLLFVSYIGAFRQPIPVSLTHNDLKGELEKAISSTYMHQNRGSCTYVIAFLLIIFPSDLIAIINCRAVKFGIVSQKPSEILANLKSALPAIAKKIWGGWENIQSIHIKTNSSVSLPIWMCSLDDSGRGRWGGLAAFTTKPTTSAEENEGNLVIGVSFESDKSSAKDTKSKYSSSLAKRKDKVVNRKEAQSAKSRLVGRKLTYTS